MTPSIPFAPRLLITFISDSIFCSTNSASLTIIEFDNIREVPDGIDERIRDARDSSHRFSETYLCTASAAALLCFIQSSHQLVFTPLPDEASEKAAIIGPWITSVTSCEGSGQSIPGETITYLAGGVLCFHKRYAFEVAGSPTWTITSTGARSDVNCSSANKSSPNVMMGALLRLSLSRSCEHGSANIGQPLSELNATRASSS